MEQHRQPIANLPEPLEGYGLPEKVENLLAWEFVTQRMEGAQVYWVCTVAEDNRPHARPVWGVWMKSALFFGGGPGTRWFRNLQDNPKVSIHSEDGTEAIIFEGYVSIVGNESLMETIDDAVREATMMGQKKLKEKKKLDNGDFLIVKEPMGTLQQIWYFAKGPKGYVRAICSAPAKEEADNKKICQSLKNIAK